MSTNRRTLWATLAVLGVSVLVSLAAAAPAGVTTGTMYRSAAVSGSIAYTGRAAPADSWEGDTSIYRADADGTHRRRLARQGESPAWSPDGRRLAYVNADASIVVVDADGSSRRVVFHGSECTPAWGLLAGEPAWSPDGRRIVFPCEWEVYSDPEPGRGMPTTEGWYRDLWIVDVQTRRAVRLTRSPAVLEFGPAWSPDGRRIAYSRPRDGDSGPLMLYVLELRTGRTTKLVEGRSPDWSPDGRRLLYVRRGDTVAVVGADGAGARTVVAARGRVGSAAWSPDGTRIAYDAQRPRSGIYVAAADGKKARLVVPRGGEPDWQPTKPATTRPRGG